MDGAGTTCVAAGWPVRTLASDRHEGTVMGAVPAADLDTLDDHALVELCRAGRREAFDRIVVRHSRSVYQVCYRFVGNHADATDLTQETFLRAYRALDRFKGESSVGTWLYRIAVNLCLNKVSARVPRTEPVEETRLPASREPDAMSLMLESERAARVRAAIARLPKTQRATLILRVYQELPHQEIARVLDSSVGAVKTNLFHALRNLRRLLRDDAR
jgi:RNA polymerase sigma-70 factor, ECF subfamily